MQTHKGDFNGKSCQIYPSKGLIQSEEAPPDLTDFVFRVYRKPLGGRKGKFFVGCCGPLFLTLQANYLGESTRIQTQEGLIGVQVIGCIGGTALEGPRLVYDVEVSLVRWTWKPDGFSSRNKVFAADSNWLNPNTQYTPQNYGLIDKIVHDYETPIQPVSQPDQEFEDYPPATDSSSNNVFIDEDGESYILESSDEEETFDSNDEYYTDTRLSNPEANDYENIDSIHEPEKSLTPPKNTDNLTQNTSDDAESYY